MTLRIGIASAVLLAALGGIPSAARASCVSGDKKAGPVPIRLLVPQNTAASGGVSADREDSGTSIVGVWVITFLFGDGPEVFDRGFEQWHSDGTEFTIDVAVPPAAGNICVGVWKATGPRTVKLHHVGFNWDASVTPATLAGLFVLDMVVTVQPNGRAFDGKYVTDSYDTHGVVIPELHVEGSASGTRIRVND